MAKKKEKKPAKLPDKPSELIRVALADLEAVERSKKYEVNMHRWHKPKDNGKCMVCLAGAVIAKSLNGDVACDLDPEFDFRDDVQNKLFALDSFRTGKVADGLHWCGYCGDDYDLNRSIVDYERDPRRFKLEMEFLADDLEDVGL